jgi:hypothetical protein
MPHGASGFFHKAAPLCVVRAVFRLTFLVYVVC